MGNVKQSAKGDNISQTVIENAYLLDSAKDVLTKSEVAELLDLFWDIDRSELSGYDVSTLPSEVLEKLSHNNAMRYKALFENHALDYVVIEQVMGQYANSESIVCCVRDYYIKAAVIDQNGEIVIDDGNKCLDIVFSTIKNHILSSENYNKELSDQKLESFCYGLLQYCVCRCKVLEPISEHMMQMNEAQSVAS